MIRATGQYILITLEYQEKSKGGMYIPDSAKEKHGVCWGLIHSVGPRCPYDLAKGDRVMYRRYEGFPVTIKGKQYLAIQPKWVYAAIREDSCDGQGIYIHDLTDIREATEVGYD